MAAAPEAGGAFHVPWTVAEVLSDAVTKREIVTYLQRVASPALLSKHRCSGNAKNIVKSRKKRELADAFLELVEESRFADTDTADCNENRVRRAGGHRAAGSFYAADNNNYTSG
jgi:Basic tilted helix bundle domain